MTIRIHVIRSQSRWPEKSQEIVIVSCEDKVNAALRNRLREIARTEAGISDPIIVSTSPIQTPLTLEELGLFAMHPYQRNGTLRNHMPHRQVQYGICHVCGHNGDDCTGDPLERVR